MQNKPMSTIAEFKTTAAIGITGTGSAHCYLETHTPWNDSSGGYPMQIAWLDTRTPLYRWGINATTWGEWQSLGEGGGDVAGKTYVKATRTVENTGNPNSNLEVINYSNSKGGATMLTDTANTHAKTATRIAAKTAATVIQTGLVKDRKSVV